MEEIVKKFIDKYALMEKKSLVAVSGGADSMALLDILAKNLDKSKLSVAHANHGLRAESDKEEEITKKVAAKLKIEFHSSRLVLEDKSEELARAKRYEFLESMRLKTNSDYIILAHHADDQIETIILKLIRGTNPADLWGMDEENGNLLRPLLSISKEEIEEYCKKNKIKFVLDRSNNDIRYARNRIRINVIPELKAINPNLIQTITSQKELYVELAEYLKKSTYWGEKVSYKGNKLNLKQFKMLPTYMQKSVLKKILSEKLPERELTQRNILEVYNMLASTGNKSTNIEDLLIEKEYGIVNFEKKQVNETNVPESLLLSLNKTVKFGQFNITLKKGLAIADKNNILLGNNLAYNLFVRVWKTGDKIVTIAGSKKLQDIFTDAKIPKKERKTWPVIENGSEIIWVPLLAAHRNCLRKSTPETWYLEVKNATKK